MKKHDIETYTKLAEGAQFFLNESFNYIDQTLKSETASIIYSKLIDKIEPNEKDKAIIENTDFTDDILELLGIVYI